ncbi:unnamed protein product [Calicophoron daubneyi]|uniref:Hyaluronan/mRNA-binding protein domain-containing protein n=1 Tax=Calicophoron daubneyi TaxID=300641 RepID=A0AAV2TZP6_CALDB
MAGVDHAYQYSVEVKSRFSLFMNDDLNNEDPDILISKLQSERAERAKKEKAGAGHPSGESKKSESTEESEARHEHPVAKAKPIRMPKLPRVSNQQAPAPPPEEHAQPAEETSRQPEENHVGPTPRGRGGPRGFSRGFRGRGQGPRPQFTEGVTTDSVADTNAPRDALYEPRGRGRARGRGGFGRGRGSMYTDYREFDRQPGAERTGGRPFRRDGFDGNKSTTDEEVNDAVAPVGESENAETVEPSNPNEEATEDAMNEEGEKLVEEEKHYTLEEYKAMVSSAKPSITLAHTHVRKANDGKDVFANMVPHRKENEVPEQEVEEVEEQPEEHQSFEIDVSFTDSFAERSRGGRGFGGRGFDRGRGAGFRGMRPRGERGGRGGRGGFRGEGRGKGYGRGMAMEHQAAPPVIYNDQEFPSLK